MRTIVLETRGKCDDISTVKVCIFDGKSDAEKYCSEHSDNPQGNKYWTFCEIIEPGVQYEPARYKNYKE